MLAVIGALSWVLLAVFTPQACTTSFNTDGTVISQSCTPGPIQNVVLGSNITYQGCLTRKGRWSMPDRNPAPQTLTGMTCKRLPS